MTLELLPVKIFLDDVRQPPDDSWIVFVSAESLVEFLTKNRDLDILEMSLDHDLGEGKMNGHQFISWYEEQILTRSLTRPTEIMVHSANPVGFKQMKQAIDSIMRRSQKSYNATHMRHV